LPGSTRFPPRTAHPLQIAGSTPQVVPYSSCTISIGGDTYNPTGGPAQWFFPSSAAVSGKRAKVTTGFHVNGRLFERRECELRQTGTGRSVSGCVLTAAA
jgi:hypothetical protein